MSFCKILKIETPRKFLLNALWFGPADAERVFVYVHGLGGSVFSQHDFLETLADQKNTAVLTFNNRGSGIVTRIKRRNLKKAKGYESHVMGMAHEVFVDCVDDIEGAVRTARKGGAKEVFLIGQSTGCQKSIYYLSIEKDSPVKGAILLAPLSDYAATVATTDPVALKKAVTVAKKMVLEGHSHELMPLDMSPYPHDAQRFLSRSTPDSVEEIFSYASPHTKPGVLHKVKVPLLAIFASNDEHNDRPTANIVQWFTNALKAQKASFEILDGAPHDFKGYASALVELIGNWTA